MVNSSALFRISVCHLLLGDSITTHRCLAITFKG